MLKITILFIMLLCGITLQAKTLTIVIDNNASVKYFDEYDSFAQILNKKRLAALEYTTLNIVNEYEDVTSFEIAEEVPTIDEFESSDLGIIELLEKILSLEYFVEGDSIIIFSRMDYTNKSTNTRSENKIYNDAWITSSKSPIKNVINKYPNKPLKKVKIIIVDPNKDLKYLVHRERFFSLLLAEVGGELIYYGSLDYDAERVEDYLSSTKVLNKIPQGEPLKNELNLMLDNDKIQYELD